METANAIDVLIRESTQGFSLQRSTILPGLAAGQLDTEAALREIAARPDAASYHLLWALRQTARALYDAVPDGTKASVLAGALAHVRALNDWGYLAPDDSHDGEAAEALLALGVAAVVPLTPLLRDEAPAPLFGSEAATLARFYKYRRKDFAYRYIALLTGAVFVFDAAPAQRDIVIARLAATLPTRNGPCA